MNDQSGLWRPEPGGRSAGIAGGRRRRAPNNSCNCQRRPSMHHRATAALTNKGDKGVKESEKKSCASKYSYNDFGYGVRGLGISKALP